jgi:hypothetical protein
VTSGKRFAPRHPGNLGYQALPHRQARRARALFVERRRRDAHTRRQVDHGPRIGQPRLGPCCLEQLVERAEVGQRVREAAGVPVAEDRVERPEPRHRGPRAVEHGKGRPQDACAALTEPRPSERQPSQEALLSRTRPRDGQARPQLRIPAREVDVRLAFLALAKTRAREPGPIGMQTGGGLGKEEPRARRDQAIPELVVLVAAQVLVVAADLVEERPRHRAVAAQQIRVHRAVSRFAQPVEHGLPPAAEDDREPIALRLQHRREVPDHDGAAADRVGVPLQVSAEEPRNHRNVVVQEDRQCSAARGRTRVASSGGAPLFELDHAAREANT